MDDTAAFDLNIQRVLENWTVVHALRELIANALDERALTETAEPEIHEDPAGHWHVRDFGRGLRHEHLTQNESKEKLAHPELVVGKFGVGLKDALATFDRHRVDVTIRTPHADISVGRAAKHGFADVKTLHAFITPPSHPSKEGTDIELSGKKLGRKEIDAAKDLFLHYSDEDPLGETKFGQILARTDGEARIYVNGLLVASEPDFLFSYNVTSPTKALRGALNRERSNVGRQAYSPRVKSILLACDAEQVIEELVTDLQQYRTGNWKDETQWVDVGVHACQQLNAIRKVIFLTPMDLAIAPDFLRRAEEDGYQPIVVPENIARKLPDLRDASGEPIRDLDRYRKEWSDSFEFEFVDGADLNRDERDVWALLPEIFAARGGRPKPIKEVRVSETMRLLEGHYQEAVGLWDPTEGHIIVKRDQLASASSFAATVLHETCHALSGAPDVSLPFEEALTVEIGRIVARHL